MGKGLYLSEPVFREAMDKGFAMIEHLTGEDFKAVLFDETNEPDKINETYYTQPIIFLLEYALAQLLISVGIVPQYMIGHSIGEYVAACISGVFSFEDAVKLIVKRSELMHAVPHGTMLSAILKEDDAKAYLSESIFLAAVNGPEQVVFSGETAAIAALKEKLTQSDISYVTLHTSHAFHSGALDVVMDQFKAALETVTFHQPDIPFLSNLTGDFISAAAATSPDYWVRHMRETVRFSDGIKTLLSKDADLLFIEAGPGQSLSTLLKQHPAKTRPVTVNLIRPFKEQEDDVQYLKSRIGRLWAYGVDIDWQAFYKTEKRKRISLPTYSFELVQFPTEVDPFENAVVKTNGVLHTPVDQPLEEAVQETKIERPDLLSHYVAPVTDSEQRLKHVFENFFGIADIGVEDNYFELGGDSLKGMVLLRRIKNEFDINMTLKDFFGKPTIRKIAADIDEIKMLLQRTSTSSRNTIEI
jgi:acyl transferase domain-containing protein